MQMLFFASGDLGEGNASNARFICYGKGLMALDTYVKFYLVAPTEFNTTGVNAQTEGTVDGVPFQYLGGSASKPKRLLVNGWNRIKSWIKGRAVLRRNSKKDTVLYFYSPQLFTTLPILVWSRILGYKVVIELSEFHSLGSGRTTGFKNWLSRMSHRVVELNLSWLCDHLHIATKRLKRYHGLRHPNLSKDIMPIVFDPERFQNLPLHTQTYRLGYIGSFGEKDGVVGIIEAFAKARKQLPSLKLRLIGHATSSFNFEAALKAYGLAQDDPNLEITGQVLSVDIPRLLAECDTLIQNRKNSPYANYGFPIKLAEYMATGRPVISTDVSDIGDDMENGKEIVIIEPENSDLLHRAILERYKAYEHHNEIGCRGQARAIERYGYQKHTTRIKAVASGLIKA